MPIEKPPQGGDFHKAMKCKTAIAEILRNLPKERLSALHWPERDFDMYKRHVTKHRRGAAQNL
jgi:hypothetical protein